MEYEQIIDKIITALEKTNFAVLATANKDGVVSATQMTLINDGLKLFFQTDGKFEKVQNIKENPNVGVNIGTMYFKGLAKVVGHPTTNPLFIEKVKSKAVKTWENYTNLPNEVLIEVDLTECKIWGIDNSKDIHNQETIVVVNLLDKTIRKIICDKM